MFNNILKYFFRKPKLIVLAEKNRGAIGEMAIKVLGRDFNLKKEILFVDKIREADLAGKEHVIGEFGREDIGRIKEKNLVPVLSYGFKESSDVWISDLKQNNGTTFKINYQGKSVPVWLESSSQEEINSVLAAISIGLVSGLNLVEISQALGSPGEAMR